MSDAIVVTGLNEAVSDLAQLPERIVAETFTAALASGGFVIEGELRARTPVAKGKTTSAKTYGRLKDDIATEVSVGRLGGRSRVGFGNTGFVARIIEYGREGVPPSPFMREAAASAEDAAVEAFVGGLIK